MDFLTQILNILQNYIMQPLIFLFPIKWCVVKPGSAAVRFTFGYPSHDLKNGIHFGTIGQIFDSKHVIRQMALTEKLNVLTEDGIPMQVDAVIIYEICNLVRFLTRSEDTHTYLIGVSEASVRGAIQSYSYKKLLKSTQTICNHMIEDVTDDLEDFGVIIHDIRFQNLEHIDPIVRAMLSITAASEDMVKISNELSKKYDIAISNILSAISPNINTVLSLPMDNTKKDLQNSSMDNPPINNDKVQYGNP